jgi:small ligand-binding sensory domain FIST
MPFAAALSTNANVVAAIDEVSFHAQDRLKQAPHLALVFFSPHHADAAETIAGLVQQRLAPRCLVGCVGESIVGNDQEIEHQPALVLWLGHWLKPVELESFHLHLQRTADGVSLLGWPDALFQADPARSAILLLGDPFTFPVEPFLQQVNEEYRGLRVMGGMASGIAGPGACRLVRGEQVLNQGAVGVLLQGELGLRSIVSQGCRPIGRHLVVTRGQDNIIVELSGKPPLVQLQEMWRALDPRDQELLQQGLHVGRVINEYQGQFQRGDFLVRNVLGLDRESGALAITDRVRVGQTVQFHVRDAASADEDLRALLQMDRGGGRAAAGRRAPLHL